MGSMKDAAMEPDGPVCDECGYPLERAGGDCESPDPCLRQEVARERDAIRSEKMREKIRDKMKR